MFLLVLLLAFVAVVVAFYLVYVPMKNNVAQSVERRKASVARQLDEMFIFIPVEHLPVIKLASAAAVGLIIFLLVYGSKPPAPLVAAGVGAIIGYYGPELLIAFLRKQRRKQFAEQLVDGLVLLSNGLRAGFSLQQALEMLVEESRPPLSQEFELVLSEFKVGVDLDKSLENCAKRTRDADLELAIIAVSITRQMGGNIAEIFDRIVSMVRARKLLEGKVESLTAQGRLQATVVALLPYVFGFFVTKINPELMRLLWTTIPGFLALVAVVVLDLAGYFWVRKVADVRY
ncbi:MAG: type II secretion system F family protein [Lentisphaerae bacterium]|nr:type II secretion system F family protein [Lentisphaerota bacterium]